MVISTAAAGILIDALRDLAVVSTQSHISRIVNRAARRLADADGASFVLRDGDECHYVDEDAIAPLWKGQRFPLSACISGWSMIYRQQVVVPDICVDDRIPQDAYRRTFVRSLVMTPIRTLRPWAAIGVYWSRVHTPLPEEVGWLQALADSTAVAMENVRVLAELAERGRAPLDRPLDQPVRMCAWTKRIALDGEWVSIEEFLERRFGILVTHSVSEEALEIIERDVVSGPPRPS